MSFRVVSSLTSGRISGVDVFAFHLTSGLLRRGVDAKILLTRAERVEIDQMPIPAGIPIETLPEHLRRKQRHRRAALTNYLLSQAPCIYLPNYDFDHSPISAFLPESVCTVGIVHSDDPMHYDHVRSLGRFWNALVAVSSHTAEATATLFRKNRQVHRIPYGVPVLPSFVPRGDREPGTIRLLYVGRIEQTQKRILDMVRLLDRLDELGVPVQLTMVGDGPAKADVEQQGRKHIERGSLRLYGTRRNDEMPELFLDSDVFVLTSAFEGLPVSLLEAMAFGCVPVVTNVKSGIPEIIRDSVNGLVVEVGDIESMARVIQSLQEEPRRIELLGEAARRTIEAGEHSLEHMVDRYLDLFEQLQSDVQQGRYRRPAPLPGEMIYHRWHSRIRRNLRRFLG